MRLTGRELGRRLILLGAVALLGCREAADEPAATQQTMTEGQEVVVTRLVRRTVEIQVTPVAPQETPPVELNVGFVGAPATFDPQQASESNSLDVVENLFVGLTRLNHQTSTVEPALAREWETSRDGRTWTFHLREDIFWVQARVSRTPIVGDGELKVEVLRPVTAGDMVLAVQRACDPGLANPDVFVLFIIVGCEERYTADRSASDDLPSVGVRALDDVTLEVRLTQPAGYFLTLTSMGLFRPLPAAEVAAMGDEWMMADNIVTNGPFVLNPQSVAGSRMVLERNPYWPLPFSGNVDLVEILQVDAEDDAYQLWEDRNLDLSPIPLSEQASILSRHGPRADLVAEQSAFYLAYNFNSPAFSRPEVRRAFGWAIDRERLIREVHDGRALPLRHFAPPGNVGAPPLDEVGAGYNPDRARQQLAASGFADCRLMPPITYLVSSSDLALEQAELLREMWIEELGCTEESVRIEQVQFGTLLASTRPDAGGQRPDLWDLGWAAYYPDENNWVRDVLHCTDSENRQRRPCSQVDELIHVAAAESTQDERWSLYRQIERLFFGEQGLEPISPLFVRANYVLRQSWVAYMPALFGGEQFDTYVVDAVAKELERSR